MGLLDLASGTADPVYATDENGTFVAWNPGCEKFLGYASDDVVGKRCYDIIRGRDLYGNLHCGESCPTRAMARQKEPVRSFGLRVCHASGNTLPVRFIIVTLNNTMANGCTIIHVVQPVNLEHELVEFSRHVYSYYGGANAASREGHPQALKLSKLTRREIEILEFLGRGVSSPEIARQLDISYTTVRSHIQNILRKLGLHSKLEAIAMLLNHHH